MSRTDVVGIVLALGVALAGCGGDAGEAGEAGGTPATASPSSTTTASPPDTTTATATATATPSAWGTTSPPGAASATVPPDALRLTFETGGGCYDTAEPTGCGEHPYGEVADDDVRALLHDAAPRLAAVEPGPNGCGDEFVDGVSVRVLVERRVTDVVELLEVCLSAVPADDEAGAALWRLYEDARGTPGP